MVILPKGSEVGKQSVLIPLFICKGLMYICEPAWGSDHATDVAKCIAGWILSTPKSFFQLHRLISIGSSPQGRLWRWNVPFRGSSIGRSIWYCPCWPFLLAG